MDTRFAVDIGLDVGKTGHHACALEPDGNRLFDKPTPAGRDPAAVMSEDIGDSSASGHR